MKYKKFDSINVIPFIDVLLVLLAIVLLTSTFIVKGVIPIELPSANSAESKKVKKEMDIVIKADNTMYLNKKHISLEALEVKLQSMNKHDIILIHTDKKASFESFVNVLDLLKTNAFHNISIVTKK